MGRKGLFPIIETGYQYTILSFLLYPILYIPQGKISPVFAVYRHLV